MSSEKVSPRHAALAAPPLPTAADRWALFLDVDGCLLEFADDPQAVEVEPDLCRLLESLHGALDGALALVSGRGVDELDRLFGAPPWAMAGLHGFELRFADGRHREIAAEPAHEARMRREVQALAARFDGVQLEDKHAAIALHCRRAPWQLPALQRAAAALAAGLPGYELQPGHLVVEFKPAGMDKGRAVAELLQQPPFSGRAPVYLGDDLTDEHAFATANLEGGISVRVGQREPTLAQFTLPGPAAVQAWLSRVFDALPHGVPSHATSVGGQATIRP
ncbi:trehalose phosphatase [Frateuria sp. Soil773]|uniref:trehalose-phosphatase n=1 Tax=Frateuria sp. Soil773 TaxID=1736407 RepID=UPI0006F8D242|nr:trehalose-phosphatase [Frateuria sp. Soil773]KRE88717.1 trehalose phosphatase [Frateuria sp. Soil773]